MRIPTKDLLVSRVNTTTNLHEERLTTQYKNGEEQALHNKNVPMTPVPGWLG